MSKYWARCIRISHHVKEKGEEKGKGGGKKNGKGEEGKREGGHTHTSAKQH